MGQKVHPRAFRMGINQGWKSKWFARKDYAALVEQDINMRKFIAKKLRESGIGSIDINRSGGAVEINLYTSKPGLVIGRGGTGADEIKKEIKKKFLDKKVNLNLNIHEVSAPNLNAQIVCQGVIDQLEKRMPFRRVIKRTVEQVMQAGARGVKVIVGGRLNGAEIARKEKFSQGSIPLHTIRADIDYARGAAHTTYGAVGVKVWIYRGEVFAKAVVSKTQSA
ncbi:MAG: 30S ribosomal protein S3 [Patescibacteria group bacterium]|nr:30S ribosomal protein S3 [Patescibacteria group bacterium]MDD5715369.1 30S ribosomal protein S3 [Patescibacteria group bacterium]